MDLASEAHLFCHIGGTLAHDGGREFVAGLVDQRAGEILALADEDAFGKSGFDRSPVSASGGDEGEGLHALVLAIAAVGVGIEIGRRRHPRQRPSPPLQGQTLESFSGNAKGQLTNAARLGEADGGSGGIADAVHGGLGLLPEPDDEEAFGGKTSWRVQQEGFVGAGLYSPLASTAAAAAATAGSAVRSAGRGLDAGTFFSLGVDGWNGEQFGCNFGEIREGQGSFIDSSDLL